MVQEQTERLGAEDHSYCLSFHNSLISTFRVISFMDIIFFSLFQSWMVKDDMKRRQWNNPSMLWVTRLVPFFGLIIYLLYRPSLISEKSDVVEN